MQKKSTAILEIATLTSSDPNSTACILSNYATINLQPELARLPGVGQVSVFGAGQYAMRIWLDPQLLHARGLTAQDVVNAVQQQSQQVSAGQIGAPPAPPDAAFQLTAERCRPARPGGPVRRHHRQDHGLRRHHPRPRRRPRRARRAELRPGIHAERQAGRRRGDLPDARRQCPRCRARGAGRNGAAGEGISGRRQLLGAVRHHALRQCLDQRGLQDAVRGSGLGAGRHSRIPAGLARDPGARDDGAGDHHRRLRGHGRARLHREPLNTVRHRAGDRHCR